MKIRTQSSIIAPIDLREKSLSLSTIPEDRFIPQRKGTNATDYTLLSIKESLNCENSSAEKDPQRRTYSEILKANFPSFAFKAENLNYLEFRNKVKTSSELVEKQNKKIRLARRKSFGISKIPYKILEVPGVENYPCYNQVAWSKLDQIAIILANSIYILDNKTGKIEQLYEAFDCEQITSLSFNQTGEKLSIGNILGEIVIFDINTKKNIHSYECHQEKINCMDWGDLILSGSIDKRVVISDPRMNVPDLRRHKNHTQEVCQLQWSPCQQFFASGGMDKKVYVWSIKSQHPIMKEIHDAGVSALAWSKKQHGMLFSGGGLSDCKLKSINTLTKKLVCERQTGSEICSIVTGVHSNDVYTSHGGPDYPIQVWRAKGIKKITKLQQHKSYVSSLLLSPCGKDLISVSQDDTLCYWQTSNSVNSQIIDKKDFHQCIIR